MSKRLIFHIQKWNLTKFGPFEEKSWPWGQGQGQYNLFLTNVKDKTYNHILQALEILEIYGKSMFVKYLALEKWT